MFIALAGLSLLLCAATLLPIWRHDAWWVRAGDFPRLQIACLLGLLTTALIVWLARTGDARGWLLLVPTAGCLIYQLWWIAPYTPFFPKEVRNTDRHSRQAHIRVLAANVLTPNRQADRLLQLVRTHRPDVLVALETDRWWQDRLDTLGDEYPHAIKCPLDNLYGMHVYSRLPLEEAETRFLVEDDKPSMHALVRLRNGVGVRMHFLHPAPPSPTENDSSGERDAELLVVAKSVADSDAPVIVTGDLNDVAWSHTTRLFRKISGLLDPRVGRGMYNSYHAGNPLARWPLDHLFHSHHFRVAGLRRLPPFGSDHFAVWIDLAYAGEQPSQEGLEDDAADHAEAREKMAEQNVRPEDVPEPGESSVADSSAPQQPYPGPSSEPSPGPSR